MERKVAKAPDIDKKRAAGIDKAVRDFNLALIELERVCDISVFVNKETTSLKIVGAQRLTGHPITVIALEDVDKDKPRTKVSKMNLGSSQKELTEEQKASLDRFLGKN